MPSEAEGRARLERMVASATPPILSPAEIDDLMALARRPGPSGVDPDSEVGWFSGYIPVVGDFIVPTNRTGVRYLVTVSDGLAITTEPSWGVPGAPVVIGGTTLVGQTDGAWVPSYDLYFAAAEGWRWKAGKISDVFDMSTDQQTFDRSQKVEHCMKMAAFYEQRAGSSIYGGGVASSNTITSARIEPRTGRLVTGWGDRPIFADITNQDIDEDQAIPWVANS
jgi:hypothetical protein